MKILKIAVATACMASTAAMAGGSCSLTNLNAWSANQNPAGKMDVTAAAALEGDCGLEFTTAVQVGGAGKHWVQDDSPNAEQRYRNSFCFDPNDVELPPSGTFRRLKMHTVSCGAPATTDCSFFDSLMMKVQNVGTIADPDYAVVGFVRDFNLGSATKRNIFNFDINDDGPTRIEYDLQYGAGTSGYLKVWTDASAESDPTVLDIQGINLDPAEMEGANFIRYGQQDLLNNITPDQTYYIDSHESRRQTFIGGGSCGS